MFSVEERINIITNEINGCSRDFRILSEVSYGQIWYINGRNFFSSNAILTRLQIFNSFYVVSSSGIKEKEK